MSQTEKIWDLPVRLFHWLLVLAILLSFLTGKFGEDIADWFLEKAIFFDAIVWHARIGYFLMSLLLFRIAWGFVGSSSARFQEWPAAPSQLWRYLKQIAAGEKPSYPGHNPLGSYAVFAMLLLLLIQVGTGLFSEDDIMFSAPLASLVSSETSELLHEWHHLNFDLLLIMIGLHVAAVTVYHLWFKESLVPAMFTGRKPVDKTPIDNLPSALRWRPWWLALLVYVVALGIVLLIVL